MKSRTFTDEIYGSQFVLLYNGPAWQFARHVRKRYDRSYDGDSDFVGRCIEVDSKSLHIIIIMLPNWRRTSQGISILVHEAFHAMELALRFRDIKHSRKTSEAYAYFLDSLVRRCLTILP